MIPLGILAAVPRAQAPAGPGDPHWASVISLLHFDGPHATPGVTDETGRTWSAGTNNVTSAAEFMFGGASRFFSGGEVIALDSADWAFGTGDFTVEAFVRPDHIGGQGAFFDSPMGNWAANSGWCFFISPQGHLYFNVNNQGSPSPAGVMVPQVWQHIAASRVAGVLRTFRNGVLVGSAETDTNLTQQRGASVGTNGVGVTDRFEGYIDEVRITKGVGRYTEAFTPPTEPFPSHA